MAHDGAGFSVQTPTPAALAEVVLIKPGAVTHGFNQSQRFVGCGITATTTTTVEATAPLTAPSHHPATTCCSWSTGTARHPPASGSR